MKIVLYVVFGFAGGLAGGMGMGGGTLLIPLLTTFLSLNQLQAQAINLVSFLPTSVVSLIMHYLQGNIEKKGLLTLVLSSSVSAVCCSFLSQALDTSVLRIVFGVFLIALSLYTVYDLSLSRKKKGVGKKKGGNK